MGELDDWLTARKRAAEQKREATEGLFEHGPGKWQEVLNAARRLNAKSAEMDWNEEFFWGNAATLALGGCAATFNKDVTGANATTFIYSIGFREPNRIDEVFAAIPVFQNNVIEARQLRWNVENLGVKESDAEGLIVAVATELIKCETANKAARELAALERDAIWEERHD